MNYVIYVSTKVRVDGGMGLIVLATLAVPLCSCIFCLKWLIYAGCNIKIRLKAHKKTNDVNATISKIFRQRTVPPTSLIPSVSCVNPFVVLGHSTPYSFLTTRTLISLYYTLQYIYYHLINNKTLAARWVKCLVTAEN